MGADYEGSEGLDSYLVVSIASRVYPETETDQKKRVSALLFRLFSDYHNLITQLTG